MVISLFGAAVVATQGLTAKARV